MYGTLSDSVESTQWTTLLPRVHTRRHGIRRAVRSRVSSAVSDGRAETSADDSRFCRMQRCATRTPGSRPRTGVCNAQHSIPHELLCLCSQPHKCHRRHHHFTWEPGLYAAVLHVCGTCIQVPAQESRLKQHQQAKLGLLTKQRVPLGVHRALPDPVAFHTADAESLQRFKRIDEARIWNTALGKVDANVDSILDLARALLCGLNS